ncbi:MAG TPA: hypothetical protein VI959_01800 [Alphaproteobacteria bacterium]|nr:hypothetical protein [Alphaproteobacteria bacterium]
MKIRYISLNLLLSFSSLWASENLTINEQKEEFQRSFVRVSKLEGIFSKEDLETSIMSLQDFRKSEAKQADTIYHSFNDAL